MGKTYTYTTYNGHGADGFADSARQHREYATASELYASIDASAGQLARSEAGTGMLWRLFGLTPVIHNDPKRTCTIKTTMTYTLAATGDQNVSAEVGCFDGWLCGGSYSDTVTGAPTAVTKTVTKTVTATFPLKTFFYVMAFADGIHGMAEVFVISRNDYASVLGQATASATVSSISLTFNPVVVIHEPPL